MGRFRPLWIAATPTIVALGILAVLLWAATTGGSRASSSKAAALPTACDNFVEAARQFAEHGSASGATAYTPAFLAAPTTNAYETLKTLLDACDDQLASMTSQ